MIGYECVTTGRRLQEAPVDLGVRLWDTAEIYGAGSNEELIGPVLERHRDAVVIACGTCIAWVRRNPSRRPSGRTAVLPLGDFEHNRALVAAVEEYAAAAEVVLNPEQVRDVGGLMSELAGARCAKAHGHGDSPRPTDG